MSLDDIVKKTDASRPTKKGRGGKGRGKGRGGKRGKGRGRGRRRGRGRGRGSYGKAAKGRTENRRRTPYARAAPVMNITNSINITNLDHEVTGDDFFGNLGNN